MNIIFPHVALLSPGETLEQVGYFQENLNIFSFLKLDDLMAMLS